MILIIYLNVYSDERICLSNTIRQLDTIWIILDDSVRIKLLPRLFNLFFLFLTFGVSNHCIFEELFCAFTNSVFVIETSDNFDTSTNHQHDTSDSHQHGESHSILAVDVGSRILSSVGLAPPLLMLAFFLTSIIYYFSSSSYIASFYLSSPHHRYLYRLFCSLSIAPQAPPS